MGMDAHAHSHMHTHNDAQPQQAQPALPRGNTRTQHARRSTLVQQKINARQLSERMLSRLNAFCFKAGEMEMIGGSCQII